MKPPLSVNSQLEPKKNSTVISITLTSNSKILFMAIPMVIIIAVVISLKRYFQSKSSALVENRVAVAFFENQTGDESLDYLERLIGSNLTRDFAVIDYVETVPLVSNYKYQEKQEFDRIQELSNITHAQIIVSGEIYKQGNNLLIQARVTDILTKEIVSGLPDVTGPIDNPTLALELLSKKVMGAVYLKSSLFYREDYSLMDYVPAYEAMVVSNEARRLFLSKRYIESIDYYNRAMEIDTDYVSPLITISVAFGNLGRTAEADSVLRITEEKSDQFSSIGRPILISNRSGLEGELLRDVAARRIMTDISQSRNSV